MFKEILKNPCRKQHCARTCKTLFSSTYLVSQIKKKNKLRAVRETEKVQQSLILLVSSLLCGLADNFSWARAVIHLQNTFGQLNNAHSVSSFWTSVACFLCFIHLTFSHGHHSSDTTLQTLPFCCAISALSMYSTDSIVFILADCPLEL